MVIQKRNTGLTSTPGVRIPLSPQKNETRALRGFLVGRNGLAI